MLRVEPLRPWHLAALEVQPSQAAAAREILAAPEGAQLHRCGRAWAAWHCGAAGSPQPREAERLVFVGGVVETLGPPPLAWAFLAPMKGPGLVAITRGVRRFLALVGQVEIGIAPDAPEAARWARLLGARPAGRKLARWHGSEALDAWVVP